MEEYARETFPLEENANGLTWMEEGSETAATPGKSGMQTPTREVESYDFYETKAF